jgi:hypothetical protein
MKSSIIAILSLASFILPATDFARAQVPLALHVDGKYLKDPNGNIVRLLGVNIAGSEYACSDIREDKGRGWGIGDGTVLKFDGSVDKQALTNLLSWNVNVVRVPLNEDCWLAPVQKKGAIPPPNPMYIGQPYQKAIIAYVQALNKAGLYVILDLHRTAPGAIVADTPDLMPDRDYSLDFWTQVATTFKDYPGVLFDLFNEPALQLNPANGKQWENTIWVGSAAEWTCLMNGSPPSSDMCKIPYKYDKDTKRSYQLAGMGEMLAKVRAAGAKQPVLIGGLWWKQDMWGRNPDGSIFTWLDYAKKLNDTQIVAANHAYCEYWGDQAACQTFMLNAQKNWKYLTQIANEYPVVTTEIGEYDCATTFIGGYVNAQGQKIQGYMDFADQNGISYVGWTYNFKKNDKGAPAPACQKGKKAEPFLIADNAGTPTSFGIGLKNHLAGLVPTVTAVSPNSGPSAGGTPITVTGTNFAGARAVNFGGTAVTSFTVSPDGTSISVTSPAGNGTQNVTVTTYLATSEKKTAPPFTYVWGSTALAAPSPLAPTVTSVALSSGLFAAGPTTGGTVVEIDGTNLSEATAVYFGANAAASFSVVTAGVLTATSPAGSSQGPVDITVTTPFGTSPTSEADQFAYVDLPGLTAPISPALGSGGTTVTLTGTGFTYVTAVNFGGNPASFEVNSDTMITAFAPGGSGTVDVTVANPAGTSPTTAGDQFTYVSGSHDFNGDGFGDIAWRDTSGNTSIWLMNGASVLSAGSLGSIPTTWSVAGQRDFNGDGKCDLLWRDTSGNTAIWFMNGASVLSVGSLGSIPTNWSVAGTGDFNGDGYADILWTDNLGNVAIWFMNGTTVLSTGAVGNVSTTWTIVGTGDFNGDGMTDILWRDTSGDTSIWLMNGASVLSAGSLGNIPTTWSVAGTGDFNGDGVMDILWQDSNTGTVVFWLLDDGQVTQMGALGAMPTPWLIALIGDYDGDSFSDILWRNITTGDVEIWFLSPSLYNEGVVVSSAAFVGNVPTTWTIQNANAE